MSRSFYSAPNETRSIRTNLSPPQGQAYSSMPDSPASFLSFDSQQKMGQMKGLDQDALLGSQREGGSAYTTSASSRSDPDFRFSQDSGSVLGSSPPSARQSDGARSTQGGSPPTSAAEIQAKRNSQDGSQHSSSGSSKADPPNQASQHSNAIAVPSQSNSSASQDQASSLNSITSHLSPLSPLVQPFNPSGLSLGSNNNSDSSPNSQTTQQEVHERASASSVHSSNLLNGADYSNPQFYPYRNDVGSPTTRSALPATISESVTNTASELGPPGSLTSAAFASLGAQLGMSGPGALASLATRGEAVPGSNTSASGAEEISTIFVVGFPDDMLEREFQNMFIFAPGFEAATLKSPGSGMGPLASVNPSLQNGNAQQQQKTPFSPSMYSSAQFSMDGYNSPYPYESHQYDDVRDSSLSQMMRDQQQSASGMSRESSQNTTTARRLTIGFAKFRTRQQALDAREVLSGRRVDADRDCVLKAEMAKKNLHTKRGLANGAPASDGSSVGVGNTTGNASLPPSVMALGQHNLAVAAAAALNPQFLANALVQQQRGDTGGHRQQSPVSGTAGGQLGVAALLREREQEPMSRESRNTAFDAFHSVPPAQLSPTYMHHNRNAEGSAVAAADPRYNAYNGPSRHEMSPGLMELSSSASISPGISSASAYYRNASQLSGPYAQMQRDLDDSNRRSIVGHTVDGYTQHNFGGNYGKEQDSFANRNGYYPASSASTGLSGRFNNLSVNTGMGMGMGMGSSMRSSSPPSGGMSPRGANPADQNPPINTLYVGGLPAVLPSLTGPMSASHLEDSLRAVFSRSPGFKRLCFRQKSNGPMSFIEYESVEYATRALSDLYGHTLGGLVKGGIRLSYSKNPLGVRSNSVSQNGFNNGPLSPGLNGYGSDPYSLTPTSARRPTLDPFYQPQSAGFRSLTPRVQSPTASMPFSPFSVNPMDFGDHYS